MRRRKNNEKTNGGKPSRSNIQYREMVENVNSLVIGVDTNGGITFFNKYAEKFFGYSQDEVMGKSPLGLIVPEKDTRGDELSSKIGDILENPEKHPVNENENIKKNGERVWVAWTNTAIYDKDGNKVEVLSVGNDITPLHKAEEKLRHLNLVLRATRNVNHYITKEKDPDRLLKGICETLIENRGYYNAWIALFDDKGKVAGFAEAGLGETFFHMVDFLKNEGLTSCAAKALDEPDGIFVEDPVRECPDCPFASSYDCRGGVTVRLEHGGKLYGVLCVSVPRELVPDEEERILLKETAGDVAFALHDMELEEERAETEEKLNLTRFSVDHSEDMIFWTTSKAEILDVNENTCLKLGYTRREIESMTVFDIDPYITKEVWLKNWEIIKEKGKMTVETAIMSKDKELIPIEIKLNYLEYNGQEYNCSIVRDIGRRKRTQESLKKSEESIRGLVENSLTGISIVQNDKVLYRNPEQKKQLGSLPFMFDFKNPAHIHPDDLEKVKKFYNRLVGGQTNSSAIEFRFYPPDRKSGRSEMKWFHCRANVIEYQGEKALLVNLADTTKTKQLEQVLRVEDKMASLGRVAAGIAHEIRNPLSGINIYLKALEKIHVTGEGSEKVDKILEQMQSASGRIESVIKRVMDFSKPGEPKLVFVDINQSAEDTIGLASVALRKIGVSVEKRLGENLPKCRVDPNMISQVLLNLVTNAADAMKNFEGDKKIRISTAMEGENIVLKVSDSGPGVPDNLRDEIFDPFYTTKDGSTGIGLSISRRIITDHYGTLDVGGGNLGGAEFTIKLPVRKDEKQS